MIKKITLENFFSFSESTTIELNPGVNILVGINGSGKSNFLRAIRFLYECISGNGLEELFLKEWGGFNTVANFNESKADKIKLTYEFDCNIIDKIFNGEFPENPIYEITINKSGVSSYYIEEKLYRKIAENKLHITPGIPKVLTNTIFNYIDMVNGQGSVLTSENGRYGRENYPHKGGKISFKEQELVLRQIADPNRFLPLYILRLAIDSITVYDYFDTTPASKIRQTSFDGIKTRLLPTGENLVQILNRIKNHHSLQYEEIEAMLNKVNPNFKDIGYEQFGNNFYLTLREKKLAKTVGIGQISDGTLRFLLLLSIFLNPERGYLVSMDEPEIGLHPDMINAIAEIIKKASVNSQLIIATHSPQLLNSFDIEDVLIFEKDENNKTIVTRKTEEDFEDWNDDFLVGQLWLRGKIGGEKMVNIRIVVEGGLHPNDNSDAATFDNSEKFRESFYKLLSTIFPPASFNLEIEPGGAYSSAIKSFKQHVQKGNHILLIDSDCPKTEKATKLAELKLIDCTNQVFFMVQEMEAWILSQPECIIKTYTTYKYKGSLELDELFKKHPEDIPKPSKELHGILGRYYYIEKNEITICRKYGKLKDGPLLLANLHMPQLVDKFEDVKRLSNYLKNN